MKHAYGWADKTLAYLHSVYACCIKVKGKIHRLIGHEGPEKEYV